MFRYMCLGWEEYVEYKKWSHADINWGYFSGVYKFTATGLLYLWDLKQNTRWSKNLWQMLIHLHCPALGVEKKKKKITPHTLA